MPTANGPDSGRDAATGRFAKGNPGGPGNPHVARIARWRAAFYEAVTPEDVVEVTRVLIQRAREGDTTAIKLFLNRVLGPEDAQSEDGSVDRVNRILDALRSIEAMTAAAPEELNGNGHNGANGTEP